MSKPKPTRTETFLRFVDLIIPGENPDDCWGWRGTLTDGKYPNFYGEGQTRGHRYSYQYFKGKIPKGLLVCHSCDTPSCCNPRHLFTGSYKDNMIDAKTKGRTLAGEKNAMAKLTKAEVLNIKKLRKKGLMYREIQERFPVALSLLHRICNQQSWSHVA